MLQQTMKKFLLIPAFLLINLSVFAHDIITAVIANDLVAVKYMLKRGADLNHVNSKGETALIVAAQNSNNRMCDFLVEMDASINVQDAAGNSALMYAIQSQNNDLVQILLNHGAKTNQTNNSSQSALDLARKLHNVQIVQMITSQR